MISAVSHIALWAFARRAVLQLTVTASFFTCTLALADGIGLTLEQAQRQALARSHQLTAHDLASDAARNMAVAAAQLPDPVLKAGIDNLPISGAERLSLTDDFMTMRRIGLMQELTSSDKRSARAVRYDREADKAAADKAVSVAAIERNAALAWLDSYFTEQMVASVDEQISLVRAELSAMEAAYRGNRGTQTEVFGARSAVAALEDKSLELTSRLRSARVMLARWTGADTHEPLAAPPAFDKTALDPTQLAGQLAHSTAINVLEQQQALAQAEANIARANRSNDWSIEVTFQQRGSAYSNMISVGLAVPLQWDRAKRQDRELSARLAIAAQAGAERDERLREQVAETQAQLQEWESGLARVQRYERELLPLAAARSDAALTAYKSGKVSLAEVLAVRSGAIEVRLQALQLRWDTARLWAQLVSLLPGENKSRMPIKNAKGKQQ